MRICLGICNSQYDPLGLACPLVIRLKVVMKLLHQAQLGWSDNLPTNMKDQWWELVEMIVPAGDLAFLCSTKPEDATGPPSWWSSGMGATLPFPVPSTPGGC